MFPNKHFIHLMAQELPFTKILKNAVCLWTLTDLFPVNEFSTCEINCYAHFNELSEQRHIIIS